jgi:hypothetical protein
MFNPCPTGGTKLSLPSINLLLHFPVCCLSTECNKQLENPKKRPSTYILNIIQKACGVQELQVIPEFPEVISMTVLSSIEEDAKTTVAKKNPCSRHARYETGLDMIIYMGLYPAVNLKLFGHGKKIDGSKSLSFLFFFLGRGGRGVDDVSTVRAS